MIPESKLDEFISYMDAHDDDDLSDGAWFQKLEDAAGEFLYKNKIQMDKNDAVHFWLDVTPRG